jgi:hypothetical protein
VSEGRPHAGDESGPLLEGGDVPAGLELVRWPAGRTVADTSQRVQPPAQIGEVPVGHGERDDQELENHTPSRVRSHLSLNVFN